MKRITKLLAIALCLMTVITCFAGCSSAGKNSDEINDKTMLVAYTEDCEPFISEDENGNPTGFDVDIIDAIFDGVKNDYKTYKFVKVDKDYRIGEDDAVDGYKAYVMVGGIKKSEGTTNKSTTMTEPIITNRIITITTKDSKIKTYNDLKDTKLGIVSQAAADALDKNAAIKDHAKSVKEYDTIANAAADLSNGKIDAVVVDEFTFCPYEDKDSFAALDGALETIDYVYTFKKWDWYVEPFNESIYELKSPEYNDADEFTPLVEKYFGYNASSFDYNPVKK